MLETAQTNDNAKSTHKENKGYTQREQELISELVRSRLKQRMELEFETFDEYEVPPAVDFAMLKKPSVMLKNREFTCNKACIKLFEGVKYVLPMISSRKKRFMIVPCSEEESGTVEWARVNKKGEWENKTVVSDEFVSKIFKSMIWDSGTRYKAVGRVANSPRGLILLFDLVDAVWFTTIEVVDEETGKTKRKSVIHYPDQYKDCFGKTYSKYAEDNQLSRFEELEGYSLIDGDGISPAQSDQTTA